MGLCVLCLGMVDTGVSLVRATASRVTEDTARVRTAVPGLTVRDTAPATARVGTAPSRPRSPTARAVLTAAAVSLLRAEQRTISSPPTRPTASSSRRLLTRLQATPAALGHQATGSREEAGTAERALGMAGVEDTTTPLRSVGVFTVSRPVTPPPPLPPPLLLTAMDTGQGTVRMPRP